MEEYRAKCMKAANRKSYTITFRHPVVKDEGKKYGIKVHRGLGTTDEEVAIELTAEMNTLLKDDVWWNLQKRMEAYSKFNEKIVDAFYDPMNRTGHCNDQFLERIPMPSKKNGYSNIGLVGMSGSGKTTWLRHVCGTVKEHFPAASSCRTTTCNMEIIMSDSRAYEAVITFTPRGLLEMLVRESIEEAIKYIAEEEPGKINREIAIEKLLEHVDMTTMLNYVLGDYSIIPDDGTGSTPDGLNPLIDRLDQYFDKLVVISEPYKGMVSGIENGSVELTDDNKILELRDEIVDDVQERFSLLKNGEKLNPKGKWFDSWYYKSDDRDEFINTIKRFSSNAKSEWGTLLTPIVESMRIKGPFKPDFSDEIPKIVIYDGEGLRYRTAISSVPLNTVSRIDRWDTVILVDNAAMPIMETTKTLLKTIMDSGNSEKLMLAFTHFDDMDGDNMETVMDKEKHVMASVSSYLSGISKKDFNALLDTDKENVLKSCYFFPELNNYTLPEFSCCEFKRMFNALESKSHGKRDMDDIRLCYDAMTLYHHIRIAIRNYRRKWSETIGYPVRTYKSEHWSKIKALTRRLGYWNIDNYNEELQPLADLAYEMMEQMNLFLNNPVSIFPETADKELKDAKINRIKNDITKQTVLFVKETMWKDTSQLNRWQEACSFTGENAIYEQSMKINEIYDRGIPLLDTFPNNMNMTQKRFVTEFMRMTESALKENNGQISKFIYS